MFGRFPFFYKGNNNNLAMKDFREIVENVTYPLKLIQKCNYLHRNTANEMKQFVFKIQMSSFPNFLVNKSARFMFCLDSLNI